MSDKRHPVDAHVGARLRLRRTLMGLSQEKLGEAVGLTFQQIQKYEKGANRIGASRMYQFARILEVPPSFFFDDMDIATSHRAGRMPGGLGGLGGLGGEGGEEPPRRDPLSKRETLELVRAYYRIIDPNVRKRLFDLVKAVAETAEEDAARGGPSP